MASQNITEALNSYITDMLSLERHIDAALESQIKDLETYPKVTAELRRWVEAQLEQHGNMVAIGSGGNINTIYKLARVKQGRPIGVERMRAIRNMLRAHSLEERIVTLNLRPDRADVIVFALAPPAARHDFARRFHSRGGGYWPDQRARPVRAGDGMPRSRQMAGACPHRGQRLAGAIPQPDTGAQRRHGACRIRRRAVAA